MIKVKRLVNTCGACPSQWEGETEDGRKVYVRYRHDVLRVDVDGTTEYSRAYPEHAEGDGVMSFNDLILNTRKLFDWPERESV